VRESSPPSEVRRGGGQCVDAYRGDVRIRVGTPILGFSFLHFRHYHRISKNHARKMERDHVAGSGSYHSGIPPLQGLVGCASSVGDLPITRWILSGLQKSQFDVFPTKGDE